MLIIHKPKNTYGKLLTLGITLILSIGAILGFYALTYTPELSHAETVTYKPTINDITYMQEMTPEICQNTPEADVNENNQYYLIDKRDEEKYRVAKLRDGNCWMTENLRITDKTINSADSDMESGNYTIPASSITGWDNNTNLNKTYYDSNNSAYGAYYSWYAATAGTGTSSVTYTNATASVCPKGWRLPPTAGDGSYATLFTSYGTRKENSTIYGSQNILSAPLYLVYSGYASGWFPGNPGLAGYYWSSTAYNGTYALGVFFDSTTVSPSSNEPRYKGYTVRCLARTESTPNDNVEITINNTISLDVTSEIKIEKGDTNPSTAALPVSVASNRPYSVSISSTNPSLISSTSSTTIPSVSGNLTSPTNGWGIKLSTASTYTQITSTPTTFYTATGAEVKTIPFTVGISTSPDLPNGEYSTEITVTATQN